MSLQSFNYTDLQPCTLSTHELSQLGRDDDGLFEPCILYHVMPASDHQNTAVVTMVQVTPAECSHHRDGAYVAVRKMNADHDGKGIQIGFYGNHSVQFQLISVVAGNANNLTLEEYSVRHQVVLESLLQIVRPQYIIGSCTEKSMLEPDLARQYATILMAQVGPPSFYQTGNPYVFGMHVNSDLYAAPLIQTLSQSYYSNRQLTHGSGGAPFSKPPVKVLYSTESEFYSSTCRSAISAAEEAGFDITAIEFDPFQDDDMDGILNGEDANFLNQLADQVCPKNLEQQAEDDPSPSIFVCTHKEHDVILKRWKNNACRPLNLWMTAAGMSWATQNMDQVPYIHGGAQWHEAFDYSDSYFNSGTEFFDQCQNDFGYRGSYDQVVSYSIAVLFSIHVSTLYRITDVPNVTMDLATDEGYEIWRRGLLVLTGDTLFGPFAFDAFQRNIGRGTAGTQWLPDTQENATFPFRNKCVSPLPQADAAIEIQSKVSSTCDAGSFLSIAAIQQEASILSSKCRPCPINTFAPVANNNVKCNRCPKESSTNGAEGSTDCIVLNPNVRPTTVKSLAISFVAITWFLAMFFGLWLIKNRHCDVIQRADPQFLGLICVGAITSSSTIIALIAAEADDVESIPAASNACMAVPFLYATGWIFQYASLSVKAYRMFCDSRGSRGVSTLSMWGLVLLAWLLDLIVVIVWTTQNPLEYAIHHVTTTVDSNVITIQTIGQCQNTGGVSVWAYIAPLLLIHSTLMIATNMLLWKIGLHDARYHEDRYVAIASICVFEIFVIGIPMVFAVMDVGTLSFVVQSSVVFLNDLCILAVMFGPKIRIVTNEAYSDAGRVLDKAILQVSEESPVNSLEGHGTSAGLDVTNGVAATDSQVVVDAGSDEYKREE